MPLTLHVRDQQVSLRLVVHPMLEGAALLPRLRVAPRQVDLLAVADRVLDKVPEELLLQGGVRDVIGRTVDKVDWNDPGAKPTFE